MYQQVYDPVGGSLGLSAIFAALPLLTLFVLPAVYSWFGGRKHPWTGHMRGPAEAVDTPQEGQS